MRSGTDGAALLLAAAYLALALHGLGGADIVGDDEAREAGIVQDIVAGHWLWPRFNGEVIPDKPILYHWLAALPCAAAGFSEAAVRGSPRSSLARRNLGVTYQLAGDVVAARREYEAALAADPNEPVVHNNLAVILLRQGLMADAERELRKELAINPGYAPARQNLAIVLRALGRPAEADVANSAVPSTKANYR